MGKPKDISECGKFDALCSKNLSEREIAKYINRLKTLVLNYLKGRNGNVFKKKRGCKKIIDKWAQRAIFKLVSNSTITAEKIKSDLSLVASVRTIQQVIKSNLLINRKKLKRKPVIALTQKDTTVEFARSYIETRLDWNDVLWSDEKNLNLDGSDGYQYY